MANNRIARYIFGAPSAPGTHPEIPNLNDPTVGVIHTGTDITVHWIDPQFLNRVSFNSIFGSAMTWNSTARTDTNG